MVLGLSSNEFSKALLNKEEKKAGGDLKMTHSKFKIQHNLE